MKLNTTNIKHIPMNTTPNPLIMGVGVGFRPSHLTRIIHHWLDDCGVAAIVRRSNMPIADVIDVDGKVSRIVVYDEGYNGKPFLASYCGDVVVSRVVVLKHFHSFASEYRGVWVDACDPGFFCKVSECLGLDDD